MNQNASTKLCSSLLFSGSLQVLQSTHFSFSRFLTRRGITEALPGSRWLAIIAKENFDIAVGSKLTWLRECVHDNIWWFNPDVGPGYKTASQIPGETRQALNFLQATSYGVRCPRLLLFLQHHVDMTTGSEVCRQLRPPQRTDRSG